LMGAHCVGGARPENSRYDGIWTDTPLLWSNKFYKFLIEKTYVKEPLVGSNSAYQYRNDSTMMLPSDMGMRYDRGFAFYVDLYANNMTRWNQDFSEAFAKLIALGTDQNPGFPPRSLSLRSRLMDVLNSFI